MSLFSRKKADDTVPLTAEGKEASDWLESTRRSDEKAAQHAARKQASIQEQLMSLPPGSILEWTSTHIAYDLCSTEPVAHIECTASKRQFAKSECWSIYPAETEAVVNPQDWYMEIPCDSYLVMTMAPGKQYGTPVGLSFNQGETTIDLTDKIDGFWGRRREDVEDDASWNLYRKNVNEFDWPVLQEMVDGVVPRGNRLTQPSGDVITVQVWSVDCLTQALNDWCAVSGYDLQYKYEPANTTWQPFWQR